MPLPPSLRARPRPTSWLPKLANPWRSGSRHKLARALPKLPSSLLRSATSLGSSSGTLRTPCSTLESRACRSCQAFNVSASFGIAWHGWTSQKRMVSCLEGVHFHPQGFALPWWIPRLFWPYLRGKGWGCADMAPMPPPLFFSLPFLPSSGVLDYDVQLRLEILRTPSDQPLALHHGTEDPHNELALAFATQACSAGRMRCRLQFMPESFRHVAETAMCSSFQQPCLEVGPQTISRIVITWPNRTQSAYGPWDLSCPAPRLQWPREDSQTGFHSADVHAMLIKRPADRARRQGCRQARLPGPRDLQAVSALQGRRTLLITSRTSRDATDPRVTHLEQRTAVTAVPFHSASKLLYGPFAEEIRLGGNAAPQFMPMKMLAA